MTRGEGGPRREGGPRSEGGSREGSHLVVVPELVPGGLVPVECLGESLAHKGAVLVAAVCWKCTNSCQPESLQHFSGSNFGPEMLLIGGLLSFEGA